MHVSIRTLDIGGHLLFYAKHGSKYFPCADSWNLPRNLQGGATSIVSPILQGV